VELDGGILESYFSDGRQCHVELGGGFDGVVAYGARVYEGQGQRRRRVR